MISIDAIVSVISYIIIILGLYFSCFWILLLLNSYEKKQRFTYFPDVSIIIPAYNEEKGLEKTVKSAIELKYKGKYEIFIINDASKDRTLEIARKLEKKYKIVHVIDKRKNAGKAAALNTALKKIKTPYFAVLDADSSIDSKSLSQIVSPFGDTSRNVGAVISKMKPENETNNILERVQLIEYMMVGLIRSLLAKIDLLHTTPGVLSVYSTKAVKNVGGFDPHNLTEDFEVAVRLRKKGYLVEYSYTSKVYTTTPSNFKVFLNQRIRWSRGFIQTHKKHRDLFFNKKHGIYGIYQFPMNVIGPIIYFLAVFAISFKIYKELYEFFYKLFLTPALIDWFYLGTFQDILLGLDPSIDIFIYLSIFFFLVFLFFVMKFYDYNFFSKQPFKRLFAIIIYLMFYNYIYIYVWVVSIKREIKKEGYSWGRIQ